MFQFGKTSNIHSKPFYVFQYENHC